MSGFFFLYLELLESDHIAFKIGKLICFLKIPLFATSWGFHVLLLFTHIPLSSMHPLHGELGHRFVGLQLMQAGTWFLRACI